MENRRSKAEQEILEEVKYYEDRYFTYDEPVPFCGLLLYPVVVRNYNEFLTSNACFLLNKNDDPIGITQSHLDYLIKKMEDPEQGKVWSYKFSRLMELVFRIKNGLKCPKCGKFVTYEEFLKRYESIQQNKEIKDPLLCECGERLREQISFKKDEKTQKNFLQVDGQKVTAKDFQRLRRIVMYQNLPDFKDDSWVDKAIREDQAKKSEILSRGHGSASIEKKIVCVSAQSNYKISELYDMPIRKFLMLLTTVDDVITYTTARFGMMSGLVSFKDHSIEHWIYKKDEGLYGSSVDSDAFTNKINSAN